VATHHRMRALFILVGTTAYFATTGPWTPAQESKSLPSQQDPNKPSVVDGKSDPRTQPLGHLGAFAMFFDECGARYDGNQSKLASGQQPIDPVENWPVEAAHVYPLTEDELRVVFAIAVDTYHQVQQHDQQVQETAAQYDSHPSPDLKHAIDSMNSQRGQIYVDGIARLKLELGEESFNKLDDFIFKTYHGSARARIVPTRRSASTSTNSQ